MLNHILGNYEVKTGKVVIGDPCYGHRETEEVWSSMNLLFVEVQNGLWFSEMKLGERMIKGRVFELLTYLGELDNSKPWEELGLIGVDSGKACIVDYDYYQNDIDLEYDEDLSGFDDCSKFYQNCCSQSLNEPRGGILKHGVISASGYGDGGYEVFGQYSEGKVIAIKIVYIDEEYAKEMQEEADNNRERIDSYREGLLVKARYLVEFGKLSEFDLTSLKFGLTTYDYNMNREYIVGKGYNKEKTIDFFFDTFESQVNNIYDNIQLWK